MFGPEPPRGNPQPIGGAIVAELGPNEYLLTGQHVRVNFDPGADNRSFIATRTEEIVFARGQWKFVRVWNGDQTDWGLNFTDVPQVL